MWAWVQRSEDYMPHESRVFYRYGLLKGHEVRAFLPEDLIARRLQITPESIVVGSVEAVSEALTQLGCQVPEPNYYPNTLKSFLGREVEKTTLGHAIDRLKDGELFIKSHDWKQLTGRVFRSSSDYVSPIGDTLRDLDPNMPVWVSEPVNFVSEYRVYVIRNEIRGVCVYKGPDELDDLPPQIDLNVVRNAVKKLAEDDDRASYAFDWGLLSDSQTVLVENNDGWAIGLYPGLDEHAYVELLWARWRQLTAQTGRAADEESP